MVAQGTLFANAPSPEARMKLSEHRIGNRKVIISLLFGLLYVLAGTWDENVPGQSCVSGSKISARTSRRVIGERIRAIG